MNRKERDIEENGNRYVNDKLHDFVGKMVGKFMRESVEKCRNSFEEGSH